MSNRSGLRAWLLGAGLPVPDFLSSVELVFHPPGQNKSVGRQLGSSSEHPPLWCWKMSPRLPCPYFSFPSFRLTLGLGVPISQGTWLLEAHTVSLYFSSLPPLPIFGTGPHFYFPAISARQGCLPIPNEGCLITVLQAPGWERPLICGGLEATQPSFVLSCASAGIHPPREPFLCRA